MKTQSKIHNPAPTSIVSMASVKRGVLALIGIVCVGLAALGAVLPGLPTTIFLIAAAYLFTKSCPKLEQILIRNRFFSVFHRYMDGKEKLPLRAKVSTLIVMWLFITSSCVILLTAGGMSPYLVAIIPIAGLIGSYFVATHGKNLTA